MAEIEITLPTVQYGNVKVRATAEELGLKDVADAYAVGVASAVYLNVFTQGFKKGATLDVAAPEGADPGKQVLDAVKALDEGLGGVTELPEDGPDGVGTDGDGTPPWDNKPQVDTAKKPWESMDTAPAPVVDDVW